MKKCEHVCPATDRSASRSTRRLFFSLTIPIICILSNTVFGQAKIVGMSIACSDDHVYTWYSDRNVSVGTSENLSQYEAPHPYSLPFGKTPDDIIEVGIAGNDHVYVWYRDSTVSSGTSTELDKYQPRHPFKLPRSKRIDEIVGIDIACSNDHVYTWYSFNQVSSGTSEELDKYHSPLPVSAGIRPTITIVGAGIAGNDHVYFWYLNGKASSGTTDNPSKYRSVFEYVTGPAPCDISADTPKLNGRTVFSVGIRGPSCNSKADIVVRLKAVDATQARTLVEGRGSGSNFELPITFACTGKQTLTLLSEIESQGRIVKSANSTIASCF